MKENHFYIIILIATGLVLNLACNKEDSYQVSNEVIDQMKTDSGCDEAIYDNWETSEYVLPYGVGKSHTVILSHCSGSYHSAGQPDQFAIDFAMDIGTEITVSRSGTVVFVEESGEDGGFQIT